MTVMIDLMVIGLYDVGCQWANIDVLPGSLVGLNQAPHDPWDWHSISPQPMWDSHACPS